MTINEAYTNLVAAARRMRAAHEALSSDGSRENRHEHTQAEIELAAHAIMFVEALDGDMADTQPIQIVEE